MPKQPARTTAALAAVIDSSQKGGRKSEVALYPGRRPRILYFERKGGALTGNAWIGRATFNRTGKTIFYRDQVFRRISGGGFKSNYYDEATGDDYWISGCKRRGGDALYATNSPIAIDEDVRREYWLEIRNQPDRVDEKSA